MATDDRDDCRRRQRCPHTYGGRDRLESMTVNSQGITYKINAFGQRVQQGVQRRDHALHPRHPRQHHRRGGRQHRHDDDGICLDGRRTAGADRRQRQHRLRAQQSGRSAAEDHEPSRTLVWDQIIEPFGEVSSTPTSTTPTNIRFPGQYADANNALYHNNNRDFDPNIGYIEHDPIGFAGGYNPFAYAGDNPTQWTDRLGLSANPTDFSPEGIQDQYGPTATLGGLISINPLSIGIASGEGIVGAIADVFGYGADDEVPLGAAKKLKLSSNQVKPCDPADDSTTLYRGVSSNSPNPEQYASALNGDANPLGGDAGIVEHLMGNNNSQYTSWTTDLEEAYGYATRNGETSGVVLTKTVPSSSMIPATSGGLQIMRSTEVLLKGPITDAIVTLAQ